MKSAWQAPPSTPLAVVNGEPITVAQWMERMSLMVGVQALDGLTREVMVRQAAQKQGIKVTPAELEARVDAELKNFRARSGSEQRFQEFLKQQKMTVSGLREVFRATTEMRIIQEKLRDKVTASVKVTDKDLQDIYDAQKFQFQVPEEARINHILVAVNGTDPQVEAAARTKAEEILTRAKGLSADKFAELAKQVSEDTDTKAKGGELPTLRKPTFFGPAFDNAVFSAQPGLVGEPVRSFRGYHIVYLHEKQPAHTKPLDEVKGQLQEQVLAQKKNQQFMTFMNDLQTKAKQEVRLQY